MCTNRTTGNINDKQTYRSVNVINSREVRDLSVRQVTELMCEVMKEFLHLLQYNRVKTI